MEPPSHQLRHVVFADALELSVEKPAAEEAARVHVRRHRRRPLDEALEGGVAVVPGGALLAHAAVERGAAQLAVASEQQLQGEQRGQQRQRVGPRGGVDGGGGHHDGSPGHGGRAGGGARVEARQARPALGPLSGVHGPRAGCGAVELLLSWHAQGRRRQSRRR
jgi:hypothetical protein